MYTIETHQHRLAAWAASTAASASKVCRFKVSRGFAILEAAGFTPDFVLPENCSVADAMDKLHEQWRHAVVEAAGSLDFSHGIAAKLINTYLKTRFIVAGQAFDPRVAALHPPIDRLLLGELAAQNVGGEKKFWREYQQKGWSKFKPEEYQAVISKVRECLKGKPMWMIEQYWCGHQGDAESLSDEKMGALWEPSSASGVRSASNLWPQAKACKATEELKIAYGGGIVTVQVGDTYYVDNTGRVLIGFHGSYNPPSDMNGETLL